MIFTYLDIFHLSWSDAWIWMRLKLRVLINCESLQYLNMRPLEPNVQIYVKTMWKLEMHWHIFLTRTVAFCLVKQTAHLQVVYMQSILPLGASNLLSKSSEIWEQLCSEPAFSSLHFVSSASSSVDKRLSTDFTWQPAGSRARTGSPPRDQAKSLANPKALLPVAGQTQGSERGSPKVGRS